MLYLIQRCLLFYSYYVIICIGVYVIVVFIICIIFDTYIIVNTSRLLLSRLPASRETVRPRAEGGGR